VLISTRQRVIKCQDSVVHHTEDEVAVEYPLTIMLNGEEFATIVCSPSDLEELVLGFLAAEGAIRSAAEVKSLEVDQKRGFAYVETANPQTLSKEYYSKRWLGSCCGKSRQSFYFYNDAKTAKTVTSQAKISISECYRLMEMLQEKSSSFRQTGGVHNAALCEQGKIIALRTDIGRHNTLDKLYGFWLRHPFPLSDKLIAFSGRISSEVLLKVAKMGVGILLSKSAPTDLALNLADELGITTVGFIRRQQGNIYTHPERILPT
jgi:FdhD protein